MAEYKGPLPAPTPDTQPYWSGLKEHVIRMQRCNNCTQYQFYPRPLCSHCGSTDLEWALVSGKGTIYSYTLNHRPPPGLDDETPLTVAVVQLEEGPRVVTNIVGTPAGDPSIQCGASVEPVFHDVTDDITLLKFRLAS